ncbi:hypothetical protein LC593_10865 [Nostoc sp. CHAB 5844]|nr:hypothetical protein [Nostoc sp. CHAB 5844]
MNIAALEVLNITLKEARANYLAVALAQTAAALQSQGFTFTEILDALTNYAYINGHSVNTVLFLSQASYSSIQECANRPSLANVSDSHTLEP